MSLRKLAPSEIFTYRVGARRRLIRRAWPGFCAALCDSSETVMRAFSAVCAHVLETCRGSGAFRKVGKLSWHQKSIKCTQPRLQVFVCRYYAVPSIFSSAISIGARDDSRVCVCGDESRGHLPNVFEIGDKREKEKKVTNNQKSGRRLIDTKLRSSPKRGPEIASNIYNINISSVTATLLSREAILRRRKRIRVPCAIAWCGEKYLRQSLRLRSKLVTRGNRSPRIISAARSPHW